jgi:hypothetical protein
MAMTRTGTRAMRRKRPLTASLLLIGYSAACTSFQTTDLAPHDAVTGQTAVMVDMRGTTRSDALRIEDPWVRNDSIGGRRCQWVRYDHVTSERDVYRCTNDAGWSVSLSSVSEIRTEQLSVSKTIGVVLGGTAVAVVVAGTLVALESGW